MSAQHAPRTSCDSQQHAYDQLKEKLAGAKTWAQFGKALEAETKLDSKTVPLLDIVLVAYQMQEFEKPNGTATPLFKTCKFLKPYEKLLGVTKKETVSALMKKLAELQKKLEEQEQQQEAEAEQEETEEQTDDLEAKA
jgi:hypothetical protein